MKTYEINYTTSGTVVDYCRAWVNAESEEQAIKYLKDWNWNQIEDTETLDTLFNDDYDIVEIGDIMEENDN